MTTASSPSPNSVSRGLGIAAESLWQKGQPSIHWSTDEFLFAQATIIPGAPLRLHALAHGLPEEWEARIEDCRAVDPFEWFRTLAVDGDTLEVNRVNATHFHPQAVTLRYRAPVELDGYSARMQIRDGEQGRVLLALFSDAAEGEPRIVIDNAKKTIAREVPAEITKALRWTRGVYDLEMVSGDYVVKIGAGNVFVHGEVTR